MRKVIVGALLLAAGLTAVRLGPTLAERGMKKCHAMMAGMAQSNQQACACHEERVEVTV